MPRLPRPVAISVDAAAALAFAVIGQAELGRNASWALAGSAPRAVSAVLALLIPLPLVWRRRHPLPVLIAIAAAIALPGLALDRAIPYWPSFRPGSACWRSRGPSSATPRSCCSRRSASPLHG